MGEVYQADDLDLGGAVALKFLPSGVEKDERRLDMLLAEARTARVITHPNVCRVHDIGVHRDGRGGELHFVSMEYIDGENLTALLRRIGRLPRDKALEVSRELCSGLASVHASGLLHRDIKPSNIMLDGRGHVRLTDFGLAISGDSGTRSMAGTPAYMAPEQLTIRETTVRSDIYALGLVLYEVFTGRRVFAANSIQEYAWLHLERRPEAPSDFVQDLHPEIERVILACLEKVPEQRMASVEAVGAILTRVASEEARAGNGSMEQGEVLRALLVCDLVATSSKESLGERRTSEAEALHDGLARDLLTRHAGRELDKADGFLLLFEHPSQALGFALDYHDALAKLSADEGAPLQARVGIHFGDVWLAEKPPTDVRQGERTIELDGLAKVVATRLMSLANGGQILLSRSAFDLARRAAVDVESGEDLRWLDHGGWRLHGVADPVGICEVGREGRAPLVLPAETEKAHRLLIQPRIEGWRPTPGLNVPGRAHWQIESRLGEGGFGEAWLARHTKTSEPRCFKFCFDAERLRALQREITLFRLLKETLGDRDDINRILDWNLDEAPYCIESEYTEAGDLEQWAESEGGMARVPLATRLEVIAQIADALAAAHSVGVLHKDIKPSNILIRRGPEGRLQAQLADFGVGQVTQEERLAAAGITMLGLTRRAHDETARTRSGTPLYMAPERLEGRAPTQQADIYALGVLLYQAVSGDLGRVLAPGWERDIEDRMLANDIAFFADGSPELRPSSAKEVAQRLRTLHERRQAHRTAEAERRSREVARRRRTMYKAVAITASVSLIAVSTLAIWALRASHEERKARQTTERVLTFVIDLFTITDPFGTGKIGRNRGETITAREILDRGATQVDTEFSDEPVVQARLLSMYGKIYSSLGLYDKAKLFLGRALAAQENQLRGDRVDMLATMNRLSRTHFMTGEYVQSKALAATALKGRTEALGAEHPDTLKSMRFLANSFYALGDYAESKRLEERILELATRVLGAEHPDTLVVMGNLANSHYSLGQYEEARRLGERTLVLQAQALGANHPDTLRTMSNLANSYYSLGDYVQSERLADTALQRTIGALGAEHPNALWTMANLARSLSARGQYAQSEQLVDECLERTQRVLGDSHELALYARSVRAMITSRQGDLEAGETALRGVLDTAQKTLGERNRIAVDAIRDLGEIVLRRGEWERAQHTLEAALDIHGRVLPPDHPSTQEVKIYLARALLELREIERAKGLASAAWGTLKASLGPRHGLTTQAARTLLEVAIREGDTEAELRWLAEVSEQGIDFVRQREAR